MDTTRPDFGRMDRTSAAGQFMGSAAGLHPSAGLLMTPSGFLDAHHAQPAGGTGALLRTGLPELGRSGPPHATPAGSVSTPTPISQCQGRYYSSLSINTGSSNYAYLHSDSMAGSMPPPSPSPFRTPPGLPNVRHHWSHTPPPPPLDGYGRYGLGASLYSLYPMLSGTDASTFCMQASAAARLLQKSNPYHHLFGATRDLGLYHHAAGLSVGSPYSPTLTVDPTDLGGTSSAVAATDAERAGTPLDFLCKSAAGGHGCPPPLLPVKLMQTTGSSSGGAAVHVDKTEPGELAKKKPAKESRESVGATKPPTETSAKDNSGSARSTTPGKSGGGASGHLTVSRTLCDVTSSTTTTAATCKTSSRPSVAATVERLRKSAASHQLKSELVKSEFQRKSDSCRRTAQMQHQQQECNKQTAETLAPKATQSMGPNSVQVHALNLTRDARAPPPSTSLPLPLTKVAVKAGDDGGSELTTGEKRRRDNEQRFHRYLYPFSLACEAAPTSTPTKSTQVPLGSATEPPFCDTNVRVKQEKPDCPACPFKSSPGVAPPAVESDDQPMALTTSPSRRARPSSPDVQRALKGGADGRKDCSVAHSDRGQNRFQVVPGANGRSGVLIGPHRSGSAACEASCIDAPKRASTSKSVPSSSNHYSNEPESDPKPVTLQNGGEAVPKASMRLPPPVTTAAAKPSDDKSAFQKPSKPSATATLVPGALFVAGHHRSIADGRHRNLPPGVAPPMSMSSAETPLSHQSISQIEPKSTDVAPKEPERSKTPQPPPPPPPPLLKSLDEFSEQSKELNLTSKCKEEEREAEQEGEVDDRNKMAMAVDGLEDTCIKQQSQRASPTVGTLDLSVATGHSAFKNSSASHDGPGNNHLGTSPEPAKLTATNSSSLKATVQRPPLISPMEKATPAHLVVTAAKPAETTSTAPKSHHQGQHRLPSSTAVATAFQSGSQHSISARLPHPCPQECFVNRTSSPPSMPYDYTTKIKTKDLTLATCTTTVTTTTPATLTTVSLSSSSLSSSTFQSCFSQHVRRAMASVPPSTSASTPPLAPSADSTSSTPLAASSSSSHPAADANVALTVPVQCASTTVKRAPSALSDPLPRSGDAISVSVGNSVTKVGSQVPPTARNQAAIPGGKARNSVAPSTVGSAMPPTTNKKTEDSVLKTLSLPRATCPPKLATKTKKGPASNIAIKPAESSSAEGAIFPHTLTNGSSTIPVGIAVARQRQECNTSATNKQRSGLTGGKDIINKVSQADSLAENVNRPEQKDFLREQTEVQQCREKTSNGQPVPTTDFNSNLMVAGTATSTSCWDDATKSGNSLQARWMPTSQHGHNVSQALWLGQAPFTATPAPVSMQISSVEHSHLQFPPLGYQLARDQITNHLFLIPTANLDVMERPPIWPAFAATAAATAPQLQPHHNPFQPFIFQQQQQLLQQDSQRTTIEFRLQQDPSSTLEAVKNPDIPISNVGDAGTGNNQEGALICQSVKEEAVLRSDDFKDKATALSLAPSSSIIADIPVPGQAFPYVIPAQNALPYFFDPQTATAVVHVTPAASNDPLHLEASEKRSQGTSPVPCSDICLTPPSDGGEMQTPDGDVDSEGEKMAPDDDASTLKPEPVMADACNQTETPPMTDDEDDEEDDDDEDDDGGGGDSSSFEDDDGKDRSGRPDRRRDKSPSRSVKVEDISVQCELLDELYDLQSAEPAEVKPTESIDVHGLELLSNIIEEQHQETYHKSSDSAEVKPASSGHDDPKPVPKPEEVQQSACNDLQSVDVPPQEAKQEVMPEPTDNDSGEPEAVLRHHDAGDPSPLTEATNSGGNAPDPVVPLAVSPGPNLGGLGLLCALAEQRILQETLDSDTNEETTEVKEAGDQRCSDESKDQGGSRTDVDGETVTDAAGKKGLKPQKEFKDFIAHKMMQYAAPGNKSPATEASDMDAAELQMRMRLAELQKKYKEKQKELAKLLPKKEKDVSSVVAGSVKRGPGRPRKRKFLPLYETKLTKLQLDCKLKSSGKKDQHMMALQSLIGGASSSKKSHQHSNGSKASKAASTAVVTKQRPILKPAVLKPPKASTTTSMDWLSNGSRGANTAASGEKSWLCSAVPSVATKNVVKPPTTTTGTFNFLSGASTQNKFTVLPSPGETLKISPSIVLKCIATPTGATKLAPQVSRLLSSKATTSTPEESTTETSDSDDSSYYLSGKCAPKSLRLMKEVLIKTSKRKDLLKNGKGDSKRSSKGDDDDSAELSKSFSSLSVSCTMPPFQGCEEPSGLGLLAKYASQVVEQSSTTSTSTVNQKTPEVTVTITPLTITSIKLPAAAIVSNSSSSKSTNNNNGSNCNTTSKNIEQDIKPKNKTPPKEEPTASLDQDATSSAHKRKPGRPKKHSPVKAKEATETIVAKKPKPMNFMKMNSKTAKQSETGATKAAKSPEAKYSFLEDEAWLRRRSERIFLNEPRVNPGYHPQTVADSSLHKRSSTSLTMPSSMSASSHQKPATEEGESPTSTSTESLPPSSSTSMTSTPWKSKSDDTPKKTLKPGSKLDRLKPKKRPNKGKSENESPTKKLKTKLTKTSKDRHDDEDHLDELRQQCQLLVQDDAGGLSPNPSEPDSPENSSFSEGDNLPLSQLIERPTTPEPRSCIIKVDELQDRLRVLTMMDGLFYAGSINAIRAPDVYGITIDGERGNRPHIYSREEILQEAIIEVKPRSLRYLPEGTRVCAFWSQQYRCLYPGTVAKSSSPNSSPDKNCVNVEFDDGDSGRIPIDNIRLLPPGLPIISYEPDPLILGKRRTKSTGDLSREKRTIVPLNGDVKETDCGQTSPAKSPRKKSPIKSPKGKTESSSSSSISSGAICGSNCKVVAKRWEKTNDSNCPQTSTTAKVLEIKITDTMKELQNQKPETKVKEGDKSRVADSKSSSSSTSDGQTSDAGNGRITTTFTTVMGTTTITSSSSVPSSVVATGGGSTGDDKSAAPTAASPSADQSKQKKHKKRRGKPEDKRHHHHHRHHHHRKHKQAEEERRKKDTNSVSKENDEGLCSSSQSEDKDDYSESGTDDRSEKSEDSAPAPKKAKVTNSKSENSQKPTPKPKGKERSNSVESKSKIAAFLPARQLWKWSGKSFRRPGTKGKAKKEFYKSITRGRETINVGDCAVFLSTGRPHLPYIGRIIMMWESWGGNMIVKVRWFYHPEETKGGRRLTDNKGALYQSFHVDENDVQTISHKCEVLSWGDYKAYKAQSQTKYGSHYDNNNDTYYLAGMYDPTTGVVTLEPGVS